MSCFGYHKWHRKDDSTLPLKFSLQSMVPSVLQCQNYLPDSGTSWRQLREASVKVIAPNKEAQELTAFRFHKHLRLGIVSGHVSSAREPVGVSIICPNGDAVVAQHAKVRDGRLEGVFCQSSQMDHRLFSVLLEYVHLRHQGNQLLPTAILGLPVGYFTVPAQASQRGGFAQRAQFHLLDIKCHKPFPCLVIPFQSHSPIIRFGDQIEHLICCRQIYDQLPDRL